jgi:Tfp pilus assembly protein PilE
MKKSLNVLELLTIVVVIGILSWITFNQFVLAQEKSRDLQRRSDLHEFSKIIRLYQADYGKLPSNELINGLWGKSFVDGDHEYAKSVPKEKVGDKEYCYEAGADGISFKMAAEFENKNDFDCKKDGQLCNGIKYCYTDIVYVNKTEN